MIEYDVVVIGSGIAGMTASIYLKRGGLNTLVIENNALGGQLVKGFDIENYPGYMKINSVDLAENIYKQVNNLKVDYLFENISKIDLEKKEITIKDKKIRAKYIVIACGRREKRLNLENEDKLIGNGISFCATCDGNFYKNKDVVVVGGSNTAVTEAIYLANIVKSVTILYRKGELRSERTLIDRLDDYSNIRVIYNVNVDKYNLEEDKLVSVTLDNGEEVFCDGVFLAVGFIPNSEMFNCDKENGYIIVDDNFETSIRGVYAVGDIVKKKIYQLTTAASDATIAAGMIIEDIHRG